MQFGRLAGGTGRDGRALHKQFKPMVTFLTDVFEDGHGATPLLIVPNAIIGLQAASRNGGPASQGGVHVPGR